MQVSSLQEENVIVITMYHEESVIVIKMYQTGGIAKDGMVQYVYFVI